MQQNLSLQTKRNRHIRDRIQKKLLSSGTTDRYIQHCVSENKNKITSGSSNLRFEKHHIIPRFLGGADDPENIAFLTPRQHALVHLFRYLEFGDENDLRAYILRTATLDVDLSSHGKRMAEYNRQVGNTFWNSEFQSEQGKKGGQKGGSANTPLQQEARSRVGTKWGPIVGLKNQSQALRDVLLQIMVFYHEGENVKVEIPVCKTAAEVFDCLNSKLVVLGKEHLFSKEMAKKAKGGGPMYGLIRGSKKRIYGWSIIDRRSPPET